MTTKWTDESFATFANADETTPVPTPNEWRTDFELRQIEREMIREQKDPAGFAAFCFSVLALGVITDVATTILLRLLGVVNGLRRVRPCHTKGVLHLLEQIEPEIEALRNGPRKDRLNILWYYNAGIFFRDQGLYTLAAELQENSATRAKASGDMQGWAIGRFCATVERVNHALKTGKGIKKTLQRLRGDASKNLVKYVPATGTEYHWVVLNAPIHRIMAHYWANESYLMMCRDWMMLLNLKERQPELAKAHARAIQICNVMFTGGLGMMTMDKIHPEDTIEQKASILLVRARLAIINDLSMILLKEIIDLPEDGVQQVRAVARRKLEFLELSKD